MVSNQKLSRADIKKILDFYNLGYLKSYRAKVRYREGLQPVYILKTSKGKFFLKQYFRFDYFRRKGLLLINFLLKKNYPCIKVFNSKEGEPYIKYKGKIFAIFELVSPRHRWWNLSEKEAYETGKYLGKLHVAAKNFPIWKRTHEDYDYFLNAIEKNYYKIKGAPQRIQKVFKYIKNNFEKLRVPSDLPKSICHEEFFPPHLRFKNQKLVKVLDWDDANRNYMFYDLGVCTVTAFFKKLNIRLLANIIKAYNKERELTDWEREHIFEAVQFGIFKFAIWGLEDEKGGRHGWGDYTRTLNLMKYNKAEFNKRLSKFIKL